VRRLQIELVECSAHQILSFGQPCREVVRLNLEVLEWLDLRDCTGRVEFPAQQPALGRQSVDLGFQRQVVAIQFAVPLVALVETRLPLLWRLIRRTSGCFQTFQPSSGLLFLQALRSKLPRSNQGQSAACSTAPRPSQGT